MESENETVEEIVKEMRDYGQPIYIYTVNMLCDRIESAHRREVAELRECLKKAVFVVPTLFDKQMPKWRKALKGAKYE